MDSPIAGPSYRPEPIPEDQRVEVLINGTVFVTSRKAYNLLKAHTCPANYISKCTVEAPPEKLLETLIGAFGDSGLKNELTRTHHLIPFVLLAEGDREEEKGKKSDEYKLVSIYNKTKGKPKEIKQALFNRLVIMGNRTFDKLHWNLAKPKFKESLRPSTTASCVSMQTVKEKMQNIQILEQSRNFWAKRGKHVKSLTLTCRISIDFPNQLQIMVTNYFDKLKALSVDLSNAEYLKDEEYTVVRLPTTEKMGDFLIPSGSLKLTRLAFTAQLPSKTEEKNILPYNDSNAMIIGNFISVFLNSSPNVKYLHLDLQLTELYEYIICLGSPTTINSLVLFRPAYHPRAFINYPNVRYESLSESFLNDLPDIKTTKTKEDIAMELRLQKGYKYVSHVQPPSIKIESQKQIKQETKTLAGKLRSAGKGDLAGQFSASQPGIPDKTSLKLYSPPGNDYFFGLLEEFSGLESLYIKNPWTYDTEDFLSRIPELYNVEFFCLSGKSPLSTAALHVLKFPSRTTLVLLCCNCLKDKQFSKTCLCPFEENEAHYCCKEMKPYSEFPEIRGLRNLAIERAFWINSKKENKDQCLGRNVVLSLIQFKFQYLTSLTISINIPKIGPEVRPKVKPRKKISPHPGEASDAAIVENYNNLLDDFFLSLSQKSQHLIKLRIMLRFHGKILLEVDDPEQSLCSSFESLFNNIKTLIHLDVTFLSKKLLVDPTNKDYEGLDKLSACQNQLEQWTRFNRDVRVKMHSPHYPARQIQIPDDPIFFCNQMVSEGSLGFAHQTYENEGDFNEFFPDG